jgi:hypothetical protein
LSKLIGNQRRDSNEEPGACTLELFYRVFENYGILHPCLIFASNADHSFSPNGRPLLRKDYIKVHEYQNDEHSRFLHCVIYFQIKRFYSTGPWNEESYQEESAHTDLSTSL